MVYLYYDMYKRNANMICDMITELIKRVKYARKLFFPRVAKTQENAKCVNYKFASLSQKRKAFNANSEFVYARPELYKASILWLQPSKTFKIPDK